MTAARREPRADRLALIEAGMVLLLLVLFLFLYVVPTENRLYGVYWWSPLPLVALFFAVLLVDARRRKRRGRRHLEEMMEDHGRAP